MEMTEIGIGIAGCGGRMGRALVTEVAAAAGLRLAGGTDAAQLRGGDLGVSAGLDPLGISIGDDPEALFAVSDAVIDFTTPEASLRHAAIAGRTGKALVIGTTGISPVEAKAIERAAQTFQTDVLAKAHCPADAVVRLNTKAGVYHFAGERQ
jgi:4-hydroxy-tetrahydrodipicolinate reductase